MITLDSDTQLPREAAHSLVGAIAHPLNRAVIDPVTKHGRGRATAFCSRASASASQSASRSRLAQHLSGQTGFDIYTRAISDVYQDLFGEGIFTGKGIYDVDALRDALEQRFPENALLSHDLIEGIVCAGRAGVRHRADRRLSVALQRLQPAQASLGARRLADHALALTSVPDFKADSSRIRSI